MKNKKGAFRTSLKTGYSSDLLQKLTVSQPVMNLFFFYGTRNSKIMQDIRKNQLPKLRVYQIYLGNGESPKC